MLWLGANYPESFVGFGHPRSVGSYKSFLLKDPERSGFEVWASNRWSHLCLIYEKDNGRLRIVKDGRTLNMRDPDPEFTEVEIPTDFLSKVYVGRCNFDYKATCSGPGSEFADLNIFGRALTEQEAQDWTTCR